jgi:hypothetical protein
MRYCHSLFIAFAIVLFPQLLSAQATYPAPYDLSAGPYSFTEWSATEPAGTYPSNAIIHRSNNQDPGLTTFVSSSDYALAYNLSSGTRVNGENAQGISFLNTGTSGNLGAVIVALNTSGQVDITVSFVSQTLAPGSGGSPREQRLRLQYRIGDSGSFLDVPGTPEYSSNTGDEQTFSGIALPSECDDQPLVHLRWLFYQHAANGGGNRPRLRLDDILISGTAGQCAAPVTGATAVSTSESGASTATLTWQNGNGAARIVVLRAGSPITTQPTDGTTYTSNSAFGTPGTGLGEGFVVYNGTGSTVAVSGLTPGVTYYAEVFEYKCASVLYLTGSGATTFFTTPTTPEITVVPNTPLTLFAEAATPSSPVQVMVSGLFLNDELDVTTTGSFEVSFNALAGYSTGLSLIPVAGVVDPTVIYVRFSPPADQSEQGTLTFSSMGAGDVVIALTGEVEVLLAEPFPLCSGAYSLTDWPAASPAGTYPANMIFQRFVATDPGIAAVIGDDYTDAYNLTGGSRINGLGTDGISFINTGTLGNLGTAVLALNTLGRQDISVSYLASLMTQATGTPTPRNYGLRLQFRVGSGAWTDFEIPVDFPTIGLDNGHVEQFSDIVLPTACEDQPLVYLRWMYYQIAANNGGSRPRIRLDNIQVNSVPSFPALSDATPGPGVEPEEISSLVTGPIITHEDGAGVWAFTLRDGGVSGDADFLPTQVSSIVIERGEEDTTPSWSSQIAAAALFSGEDKLADGVVSATSIAFSGLDIEVDDNGSYEVTLRVSLTEEGELQDNGHLQFRLRNTSIVTGNDCESSGFASFDISSDPDANRIDVQATQMDYVNFVSQAMVDVVFSVSVRVTDQNGNVDVDDREVTLFYSTAGSGELVGPDGLGPFTMSGGTYTWSGISGTAIGIYTLTASSDDPVLLEVEDDLLIVPNVGVEEFHQPALAVYPNPNSGEWLWFDQMTQGMLLDSFGRVIERFSRTNRISLSALPAGIYFLSTDFGTVRVVVN